MLGKLYDALPHTAGTDDDCRLALAELRCIADGPQGGEEGAAKQSGLLGVSFRNAFRLLWNLN